MLYWPGARAAATYSPAELLFTARTVPVAVFLMLTSAWGRTAPDISRTVPVSVAVSEANATPGTSKSPNKSQRSRKTFFSMFSPVALEHGFATVSTCLPWGSAFDALGGLIPQNRGLAKIKFIPHVAGQGRMVAEDGIFDDRLAGTHSLEKGPQVRLDVVVIWTPERNRLWHGLMTQLRVILRVPLLL